MSSVPKKRRIGDVFLRFVWEEDWWCNLRLPLSHCSLKPWLDLRQENLIFLRDVLTSIASSAAREVRQPAKLFWNLKRVECEKATRYIS